jgi:hypothetical protein
VFWLTESALGRTRLERGGEFRFLGDRTASSRGPPHAGVSLLTILVG